MKITAPFRRADEVEMLLHNGADELYCGVHTPEWEAHFGAGWWMNRRSPRQANLLSWGEMKTAMETAHRAKAPVHVAMNAPFYPEGAMDYMIRLSEKLVEELGVTGLILSDLNLLARLHEANLPVRLHVSSLAAVINRHAVRFYQELGVRRIILPRQIRVDEMKRLIQGSPDGMEFEVFALNDGCLFEEGYCQTTHAFGPFCMGGEEASARNAGSRPPARAEMESAAAALSEFLWFQNNCGSSLTERGLPNGPCSLCRFGEFRDMGVTAVKIVGREASFQRKMSSLQLTKAVMDRVREGAAPREIAALSRSLRDTPDHCGNGFMCYFRDA